MKDLKCPHCNHFNDAPEDCHEQDEHYEKECENCEKVFGFTVCYYPSYSEYEVPCANGGEHDYQQIIGAPREYFIGRFRCSHCGDEIKKDIEAI